MRGGVLMLRKLGFLVLALGLALPAMAVSRSGSISGYVRSAGGVPQMGAAVEVVGAAIRSLRVFTDENGFYSAGGLVPGLYDVKVSAPSFLPYLRERIGLHAGAAAVVNVTLNTLFETLQLTPSRLPADQEDWKWVLRSSENRPILRILQQDPVLLASKTISPGEIRESHELKGTVSFLAGSQSDGFGSTSDMMTGFSVEKSLMTTGTFSLLGNVAYNSGSPNAALRGTYSHHFDNGSEPQIAVTMRRLAAPDFYSRGDVLQALSVSTSDNLTFADVVELRFGSELQTIQFMGRASAFRPFGSAEVHLSPNTLVEYRFATARPDSRLEKGFESAPADLSESGPHVSVANYSSYIEKSQHQELSLSRRIGKTTLEVAAFSDRITNPALTGVGLVTGENGQVLPDLDSGTFTYQGRALNTSGMRVVLQRKIASDLTATVDYGYGGVLALDSPDVSLQQAREALAIRERHSVAGKLAGTMPGTHTRWIASYRWTSGSALTPVDAFNASPGQADPYLSFYFRQPIPGTSFIPCHMDAIIDVRNLLAQGYVPLMGQDGRTVYLVQSARAIRGGVAFTF
jgi:Carboxypeptidase regulatory-like domain